MATVYLDPSIWVMFEAGLVTEKQAIRLQRLSNQSKAGKVVLLDKRDQELINRFHLFHVPTSPTAH